MPEREDHEAGKAVALLLMSTGRFDDMKAGEFRELCEKVASRVSPSRDGTVAVEDAIAWLDSEANRLAGNGELSDTVAGAIVGVRMRLLAEFGSARAGESNEGGNQNDERRH